MDKQMKRDAVGLTNSHKILSEIFQTEGIESKKFDNDWEDMMSLYTGRLMSQAQLKQAEKDVLRLHIERDSYATPRLLENGEVRHLELVRTFCKVLKAVRLLGTVPKAIESFELFWKKSKVDGGCRISLHFTETITSLDLKDEDNLAIIERLGTWARVSNNEGFKTKVQETVDSLRGKGTTHRYFHCELQILDRFLTTLRSMITSAAASSPATPAGGFFKGHRLGHEKPTQTCGWPLPSLSSWNKMKAGAAFDFSSLSRKFRIM